MNTAECELHIAEFHCGSPLQWGRRVNTAEWNVATTVEAVVTQLQWGRRVNTAEWWFRREGDLAAFVASMGPPREHGGMTVHNLSGKALEAMLQWGRRVNTAEC